MQKEYLIETRTVADEKGNLLYLNYYLAEEIRSLSTLTLYRIGIRKIPAFRLQEEEERWTPPLSDCEAIALGLLKKLSRNTVTPLCLFEVLDDLMSEGSTQLS